MSKISERLKNVEDRIKAAEKRSPWHQHVVLVAVTKFHPLEDMEEAIRCGVKNVGENRVQEMEEKHARLTLPVTWHLQGHLQKNKVKKAVQIADLIQSVDSSEILGEIDKRAGQINKKQQILLEFNISGEAQKHGFAPADFRTVVEEAKKLPHVEVKGLMCMAPVSDDPETSRPVFRKAHEMWLSMQKLFPGGQISILSMGMTQDFEVAVEEGATMVRVGTAIFGPRN